MTLFTRSCYTVVTRMFRWAGTGGAMGALCGMATGVCVAALADILFVIFVLAFAPQSGVGVGIIEIAGLILPLFLTVAVGLLVGLFGGYAVGAVIFAVMSLIEWRHDLPMWTSEYENTMMRWSVRASLIGSVSCASSFTFLYYLAQRDFHPYFALAVFILGAFGGFAVGLFLGARNIIRENTVPDLSTR